MTKTIKILSIIFALQLLIILAVNLSDSRSHESPASALLASEVLQSPEIVIRGDDRKTKLAKTETGWTLPDYGALPASGSKIEQLLDTLTDTTVNWPVASSANAAERFEVASGNAQKTLTFISGGKTKAELYLGTSPSYRKVHARLSDSDDIFVVELAQHEVPSKAESWLKKNLLSVEGDISKAAAEGFSVSKTDNGWIMEGLPEGATLDEAKAAAWAKRFNSILVNRLVESKDQVQTVVIQNPVFTATITAEGKDTDFAFYEKEDKWYVKTFGDTPLFEIAKYQAQPMIEVTPEHFVKADSSEPAESDNPLL